MAFLNNGNKEFQSTRSPLQLFKPYSLAFYIIFKFTCHNNR
ncbi:hypothetical protein BBU64B_F0007 (plasmid) [Borreliella burgdorferi 64b]|nr:hypothetical protein BBU64B_F0007 [Borreliella burgdorferi 64b]